MTPRLRDLAQCGALVRNGPFPDRPVPVRAKAVCAGDDLFTSDSGDAAPKLAPNTPPSLSAPAARMSPDPQPRTKCAAPRTATRAIRRALVVSPAPSHPADQGNRNRVGQMTAFLANEGYVVDFLLYPMDADFTDAVPDAITRMQTAWHGIVALAPPSRALHAPPVGKSHTIDEWWDAALDAQLDFLCRRRAYDVMWVNYAFLSRAFLHAPPRCLRVLDTHDELADRGELFERHGANPDFFRTTISEEAIGLARADIVVAMKPSEAARFAGRSSRRVVTVPTLPSCDGPGGAQGDATGGTAASPREPGVLRVGFIGSDNGVNVANLRRFLARLEANAPQTDRTGANLRVVVAGSVCRHIHAIAGRIESLGPIDDLATFYNGIDVAVAPLEFSTGQKIKVAEALAWGMPVVATADAFDGFAAADPYHALADIDAVCAALGMLATDPRRLVALAEATPRSLDTARRDAAAGLASLRAAMTMQRRRLVIVTDVAAWRRTTLLEERGSQAISYFARHLPVTVLCLGDAAPPLRDTTLPAFVDFIPLASLDAVADYLAGLDGRDAIAGCLISLTAPPASLAVIGAANGLAVFVDRWPACAAGVVPPPRVWHDLVLDTGAPIGATPLLELPAAVRWSPGPAAPTLLLAIAETPDIPRSQRDPRIPALAAASTGRLAVLRTTLFATDPRVLRTLRSLPMPAALVTLDAAPLTRELVAALASWCGVPSFDVGDASYPLLLGDRLIANVAAHIDAIGEWLRAPDAPPLGSERAPDAGWTRVFARLVDAKAAQAAEAAA